MNFEIDSKSLSEQYADHILKIVVRHYTTNKSAYELDFLKFAIISLLDEYEQILNNRGSDLFQPEQQIFNLKEKKPN